MKMLSSILSRLEVSAPKIDADGFSFYYINPIAPKNKQFSTFKAAYAAALIMAEKYKKAQVYGGGEDRDALICTVNHDHTYDKISVSVSFASKFKHLRDLIKVPKVRLKR